MRLIELRLKNLNSLKGEWHIDFADSAFVNEGIFAITGQTGAGKTTILDAVCLALYGETPRINSISKSSNEVMTRQTAECFAEVVIDLNGMQYRCRWGQRRAYGKSDGNLQDATHEIALVKAKNNNSDHNDPDEQVGDEILESKLSRTKDKIIELTRMDFQQFTRSILLAQGSFSAFLKAKADERADILEKITGTDIYATISTHVHDKKRTEEEILSKLQYGLDGLTLLDSDEEAELKATLKSHQITQNEQQHIFKSLNEQIKWLDSVAELKDKLSTYQSNLEQAKQDQQDFIPDAKRLAAAHKALEIDSQFSQLIYNRDALKRLQKEQQELSTKLPAQQAILSQATSALNISDDYKKVAAADLKIALPIIAQVQVLDTDIKQQAYTLNENNQRKDLLAASVQQLSQDIDNHKAKAADSKCQLKHTDKYLNDNSELNDLDTDMATFDARCSRLKTLLQDNSALANNKTTYSDQVKQYQSELAKLIQKQADDKSATAETRKRSAALQQQQAALVADKSLSEMRSEQEQIDSINNKVGQADFKRQQLTELSLQINQTNLELPKRDKALTTLADTIAGKALEIKDAIDKRQDKQSHLNLLQKVAKLEDYITELEDNSPCPLCGALEHPYAKHHPHLENNNGTELSQTAQTQQQIAKLDAFIDSLEQTLSQQRIEQATQKNNLDQQRQQLILQTKQAQILSNDIQNAINELFEGDNTSTSSILAMISPLKQISADFSTFSQNLEIADNGIKVIEKVQQLLNTTKQQLTEYRGELKTTLTRYEEITELLSTITKTLETAEQQQYKLASEISSIETDIKLNQQQLESVESKINANFSELTTIIADVLSLMTKYPAGKYAPDATIDAAKATEQIQPLINSINKQIVLHEGDVNQQIEPLRQQRASLVQLKQQFNAHKDQQQTLNTALSSLNTQIETKQTQLDSQNNELEKSVHLIDNQTKAFNQLKQKRQAIFADKNPATEESRLRDALEQAKTAQSSVQRQMDNAEQVLAQLQQQQQHLANQLTTATTALNTQESIFQAALAASEFTDEAEFTNARLPIDVRNNLNQRQQNLDYTLKQAQSLLAQTNEALEDKQSKPLTLDDRETLAHLQQQTADETKRLIEAIGAMSQQLTDNEKKKDSQQAQRDAIAAQKDKLQVWQQLHKLIGSADGKKYRTFAQGLTFDIMVNHANAQLHKMSDRYLLIRDDNSPLELNVIDNYQGGEIRSTKNLSGGEGFIISLALALGLSQMASQNIRVDSLFLDEGFGTLDEESLDIALDTLTSLQQEGKLIGVISHVQALKERILTQIQVKKLSGGFSEITGQGCYKITG